MAQFKRRPKGSGTVYKLSGNRRKPYIATVTTGYKTINGNQIQKPIGYFSSREDGLNALSLYNMNVDNFQETIGKITFEEIWDIIYEEELNDLNPNTIRNYKFGFNSLIELHHRYIDDIKLRDIQPIFNEMIKDGAGKGKITNARVVLSKIYNYAMRYEYCEKDYSKLVKAKTTKKKKKKDVFTHEQIKWLFDNDSDIIVQSIIIMIYTGMRPSELLDIKKENVYLNDNYMIGGMKTIAGTNRTIPIHDCIKGYIEKMMMNDTDFLFTFNDRSMVYQNYIYHFNKIVMWNNWTQSPHCGRHSFLTLANEYELNELKIKRIVGHASNDITKDIYTHIQVKDLVIEINKIPKIC